MVPVFLLLKKSDLQDPELVHGHQPKTVAVECLRLSQPRLVPDGWNQDEVRTQMADHSNTRWERPMACDGHRTDTVLLTFCI